VAHSYLERLQGIVPGPANAVREDQALGRQLVAGQPGFAPHAAAAIRALVSRDEPLLQVARQRAMGMASGHVSLLGFGSLSVGDPPDWHREAFSGRTAPRRHWSRVPYLDAAVVGDHKILWEVNRHQYLYAPAICWLVDGNPAYFALIQRHLASWLQENPPRRGVNWASSLEVAYRALTWCWLAALLREAPWDVQLLGRLAASLESHALHVERYLSLYFSPNTHLTGEALGLFCVGSALPGSKHAQRWRQRGAEILDSWLDRHVLADGVYFEQASQYQRYTAEIYLQYWRIAQLTGRPVPKQVPAALSRLFDVLRTMTDCSGHMPLMGDDDGGLLLPLDHRAPDDLRGLLLAGAIALGRPELVLPGPCHPALAFAMYGVEFTEELLARAIAPGEWHSRYFATGGIAVIREVRNDNSAVCVIDAGPHGAMNCGHAHADALAMTLTLGTQPLIVDRGTLSYIGAARNEYRATASHNTLEFDGESSVQPLSAFQWGPRPRRPTARLHVYADGAVFRGTAFGHEGTGRNSMHERVIVHLDGGAWLVFDQGTRAGDCHAVARWQLAPGLDVTTSSDGMLDVINRQKMPVARLLTPLSRSVVVSSREVSGRYGEHHAAPLIEIEANKQLRVLSVWLPALDSTPPQMAGNRVAASRQQLHWSDSRGTQVLEVSAGGTRTLLVHGWEADADLLWHILSCHRELIVAVGVRRLVSPEGVVMPLPLPPDYGMRDVIVGRVGGAWEIIPFSEPRRGVE